MHRVLLKLQIVDGVGLNISSLYFFKRFFFTVKLNYLIYITLWLILITVDIKSRPGIEL